jgi:hypothetical protein
VIQLRFCLLEYGTASMGDQCLIFRDGVVVSKRRAPITHRGSVTLQKNGDLRSGRVTIRMNFYHVKKIIHNEKLNNTFREV